MAGRRRFGWIAVAATLAVVACDDKSDKKSVKAPPTAAELEARCDELGKSCGDTAKHTAKIVEQCKLAVPKQVEKGCTARAFTLYDCYGGQLCGQTEKIWTLDDLGVLAERKNACAAERTALTECVGN